MDEVGVRFPIGPLIYELRLTFRVICSIETNKKTYKRRIFEDFVKIPDAKCRINI